MANYLERVATSASRRGAIAKPPVSGPPVLPAGRDFLIAPGDPFVIDEEQFVEPQETRAAARTEIPSPPRTTATQKETLAAPVEPKPRPTHERLSSESPFTPQVPRTLRPFSDIPSTAANEPSRERPRVRASTTVGPEEFTIGEEPVPLVHSSDSVVNEVKEHTEPDTTARPTPLVADREEEHQVPRPVQAASSDTTPIPRVDRVNKPGRTAMQPAEPSPLPALPVHLPPVAGSTTRQEQSRISIGSLEVLVNNHPQVTKTRPAPAPSRSESLNLEKRYLDRFRLRH